MATQIQHWCFNQPMGKLSEDGNKQYKCVLCGKVQPLLKTEENK
jgi:hypothetical protein